ncbi:MAG: RNA polymerase sigma factor SigJ [Acidimicrobiales bacterium]
MSSSGCDIAAGMSHLDDDDRSFPMTCDRFSSRGESATFEDLWRQHRGRLLDIGYRMLGSVADAEDVAGEAYARLAAADLDHIDDPVGWLVSVTARLCLDRLRSSESRRRAYVGPWLPEPVLAATAGDLDPADRITLDDSVRMAFLVVLEQLSPAERTSFVLHDLFAMSFADVGNIVGRSPAACRQLASRARRRIRSDPETPRGEAARSEIEAVAHRFAIACAGGELEPLLELLDPAVVGDFDSGGTITGAPLRAIDGAETVARTLVRSFRSQEIQFDVTDVNGEPGVVVRHGLHIVAVIALGVRHGQIDLIHAIGNPDKLRHLQSSERELGHEGRDGGRDEGRD